MHIITRKAPVLFKPRRSFLEKIVRAWSADRIRKLLADRRANIAAMREGTGLVIRLKSDVDRLASELESSRAEAARCRLRVDTLEAEREVMQRHVETLALVVKRDQQRVMAETNVWVMLQAGEKVITPNPATMAAGIIHGG